MSNKKKIKIMQPNPRLTSRAAAADVLYEMEPVEEPIDLSIKAVKPIKIDKLNWTNHETIPKRMKLYNSGTTAVVSAQWRNSNPSIKDGPFKEEYIFSQLHFHWGVNENEGSSHTIEGKQLPLEMHAIFRKMSCATHEDAVLEPNGLVKLVYMFLLTPKNNDIYDLIIDALPNITQALSSCLIEPVPISYFIKDFSGDYLFYLGKVEKERCVHVLPTLICRDPMYISPTQISKFRKILDHNAEPLIRNFRRGDNFRLNIIYHVNPSIYNCTILNVVTEVKESENKKKTKKYDSSLINKEVHSLNKIKYDYLNKQGDHDINLTNSEPLSSKLKKYTIGAKTRTQTASKYSLIDKNDSVYNSEALPFDRNDHNKAQVHKTYLERHSSTNIKIKSESDSKNNLNITVTVKPIRLKKLYLPVNYNDDSEGNNIEGKDMEEAVKKFAESLFEQMITDARIQIENTLQEQLIPLLKNQSKPEKKFEQELDENAILNITPDSKLQDTLTENSNMKSISKTYNEEYLTELEDKLNINSDKNETAISIDKKCINNSEISDNAPQKLTNPNMVENGFNIFEQQIKKIEKKLFQNYFKELIQDDESGKNVLTKLVKELKFEVDDGDEFMVTTKQNKNGEGDGSKIEVRIEEQEVNDFQDSSNENLLEVKCKDTLNSNLVIHYSVTEGWDSNTYDTNLISKEDTKQDLELDRRDDITESKDAEIHVLRDDFNQNLSIKPVDPTNKDIFNIKKKKVKFNETLENPEIISSKPICSNIKGKLQNNTVINDKTEPSNDRPRTSIQKKYEGSKTRPGKKKVKFNENSEILEKLIINNTENKRIQQAIIKSKSPVKSLSDKMKQMNEDENRPKWWF